MSRKVIQQILPIFTKAYTVKDRLLGEKITGEVTIPCSFDEDGNILVYTNRYPNGLWPGVFGVDGEGHRIPIIREKDSDNKRKSYEA